MSFIKTSTLILTLFLISCGGDSNSSNSNSYSIQIDSQEEIEFDNARIKVKLYGTDRNMADNEATLISESVLTINRIPSIISLEWPENDYQLISSPPVSVPSDAVYYFSITIDSNEDSVICNGDFIQDYDKTPFFQIDAKPSEVTDFSVVETTNTSCQMF